MVAAETRGLALKLNHITFRTEFSEATRINAGIFHATTEILNTYKHNTLGQIAPHLLSQDLEDEIALRYPQFLPILQRWSSEGDIHWSMLRDADWGETPSIYRDFTHYAFNVFAMHPEFVETLERVTQERHQPVEEEQPLEDFSGLIKQHPNLWHIPNSDELEQMIDAAGRGFVREFGEDMLRSKCTYSAASCAIRFLTSLPSTVIGHVRDIKLLEDRECVARPECHARGFVVLCRDNPNLRIERVVSIWKNVFPVKDVRYVHTGLDCKVREKLFTRYITSSVARWIVEAMALPSLGMPHGAFTMILDGEPLLELTAQAFNMVQRDAAWQTALDISYSRNQDHLQPTWFERRHMLGYHYEEFPRMLKEVCSGKSFVRCNFDLGCEWDAKEILKGRKDNSLEEWKQQWDDHTPRMFQTTDPLPLWRTLRADCSMMGVFF
jgi:hypothetical protein